MSKILGIALALGLGGFLLWFITRKSAAAGELTVESGGTVYEGTEVSPGVWEFVIPGNGGGEEALVPEYVPLPEPVLGSPERPLTAEIPGELIPLASWYNIRNIEETLGWTEEEFLEEMAVIRQTEPQERTVEQQYAGGYSDTLEAAESAVSFKERVLAYGGDYVNGILVPPDTWSGSVTEFAQYVRASLER